MMNNEIIQLDQIYEKRHKGFLFPTAFRNAKTDEDKFRQIFDFLKHNKLMFWEGEAGVDPENSCFKWWSYQVDRIVRNSRLSLEIIDRDDTPDSHIEHNLGNVLGFNISIVSTTGTWLIRHKIKNAENIRKALAILFFYDSILEEIVYSHKSGATQAVLLQEIKYRRSDINRCLYDLGMSYANLRTDIRLWNLDSNKGIQKENEQDTSMLRVAQLARNFGRKRSEISQLLTRHPDLGNGLKGRDRRGNEIKIAVYYQTKDSNRFADFK